MDKKTLKQELKDLMQDSTTQTNICRALIRNATTGNMKAIELVLDYIAEEQEKNDAFNLRICVVDNDGNEIKDKTEDAKQWIK